MIRFSKSEATVMGPTPPGTGEMAQTISLTFSKSTSPDNICFDVHLKIFLLT